MSTLKIEDATQECECVYENGALLFGEHEKVRLMLSACKALHALSPVEKIEFRPPETEPPEYELVITLSDGRLAHYQFSAVAGAASIYEVTIGNGGWAAAAAQLLVPIRETMLALYAIAPGITVNWEPK